jgi:hypothetical protein
MNKGDEASLGENWSWLGDDGMFGEDEWTTCATEFTEVKQYTLASDQKSFDTSSDVNGDDIDELELWFNGDVAKDFANRKGFKRVIENYVAEYKRIYVSNTEVPTTRNEFEGLPEILRFHSMSLTYIHQSKKLKSTNNEVLAILGTKNSGSHRIVHSIEKRHFVYGNSSFDNQSIPVIEILEIIFDIISNSK